MAMTDQEFQALRYDEDGFRFRLFKDTKISLEHETSIPSNLHLNEKMFENIVAIDVDRVSYTIAFNPVRKQIIHFNLKKIQGYSDDSCCLTFARDGKETNILIYPNGHVDVSFTPIKIGGELIVYTTKEISFIDIKRISNFSRYIERLVVNRLNSNPRLLRKVPVNGRM